MRVEEKLINDTFDYSGWWFGVVTPEATVNVHKNHKNMSDKNILENIRLWLSQRC